jgi:DNA-binding transcriptional regulator LsrR (DeoR family)
VRRAEAQALYAEGMTMEQIADRFGVTRQRVSTLLRKARE